MSLEEDIQQKEFRSEHHKAILNIIYTNNFISNCLNEVFKDFDVTRQQFNVLRIIKGQGGKPASINLIKDRMLDKMSDASRIVERLRAKELITRKSSEKDKRAADINITEKGLKLLDTMDPKVAECERFMEGLSAQEVRVLNELLDRIRSTKTA